MHMLCKHMQVVTKSRMWCNGMFIHFHRILNLPFNIPKVFFTNVLLLDCIRFKCALYIGNPSFFTFKWRIKQWSHWINNISYQLIKWEFVLPHIAFYIYFLKKNLIMDISNPPIIIIPKTMFCIYNSLNQCGIKPFSIIIWFWVYFRCNNWNMITIYGI